VRPSPDVAAKFYTRVVSVEASVSWSARGRALAAIPIPAFALLAWYSFASIEHPSPAAGYASIAAAAAAGLFQIHAAVYRVDVDGNGIRERFLWGTRTVGWADVLKVEAIAQTTTGGKVHRWHSLPEDAFHIVIHSKRGRVMVHRWMTGLDALVVALRVPRGGSSYRVAASSVLDRDDPGLKPAFQRSRGAEAVERGVRRVILGLWVLLIALFGWLGGVILAVKADLHITGHPFIDGTVLGASPWGAAWLTYRRIERARRRAFGPANARPPITAGQGLMALGAAMLGPFFLCLFAPRLASAPEAIDVAIFLAGLGCCWIPIATVRRCLRLGP
jgi:hypothetical protein